MEQNTVILKLEDYNEIKSFNENIKKNHTIHIYMNGNSRWTSEIYSTDRFVKRIEKTNLDLMKQIKELKEPSLNTPTHKELLNMSLWEFKKWKNNQ